MKAESKYPSKLLYYLLIPAVALLLALIFRPEQGSGGIVPILIQILHTIAITSGLWIGCMIIVRTLWIKFPWEQHPLKHLLLEVIFILIYTNLFSFIFFLVEKQIGIVDPEDEIYTSIIMTNLITLLITAIHEAVEFYKQWVFNFSRSTRLEKDTIEAKYEMLKAQVNPHFLFNSLNSLITLVEDNEKAVRYVDNMSEFLRYMLKSRDRQLVLLREEIQMLHQYLELQKSRFGENLQYEIKVDEKFFHLCTPPLVVQMLVENCLKHNVISKDKPLKIKVFADKNTLSVENVLQKKEITGSTGQGLRNISERYRFFTAEQVKINETNTTFRVTIPLLLADL